MLLYVTRCCVTLDSCVCIPTSTPRICDSGLSASVWQRLIRFRGSGLSASVAAAYPLRWQRRIRFGDSAWSERRNQHVEMDSNTGLEFEGLRRPQACVRAGEWGAARAASSASPAWIALRRRRAPRVASVVAHLSGTTYLSCRSLFSSCYSSLHLCAL